MMFAASVVNKARYQRDGASRSSVLLVSHFTAKYQVRSVPRCRNTGTDKSRQASELIGAMDRCKFSLGIPRMPVAFTEGEEEI